MSSTDQESHASIGSTGQRILSWSPLILILLLFATQLAAVSYYRLDYPINDDWRYYQRFTGLPTTLTATWLFLPAADTLHVTGKLADWIFFRYFAHDYHHLAVASYVIAFGGWLICALSLSFTMTRRRPALLFACLVTFILPLAANPYWVTASLRQWLEPIIAYHQMLPFLGLIALAVLFLADRDKWPRGLDLALAGATTLAFSLVYVSGAMVLFVFGGAAALFSLIAIPSELPSRRSNSTIGIVIAIVAGLCLAAHILAPLFVYEVNPIIKAREHSLAYPWVAEFWIFFFALFDRAVLSTGSGAAASIRGVAVALLVVAPSIGLTFLGFKRTLDEKHHRSAMVLVATTLAVIAYAALVSYGRGKFGLQYLLDASPPHLRASLYAHHRFFYWWITALLPLTVISWGILLETVFSRKAAAIASLAIAAFLLLPKGQLPAYPGAYLRNWDYAALYQRDADELQLLMARDIAMARGREVLSPRRKAWYRLPPNRRNPRYKPYEKFDAHSRMKPLYQRARMMEANFMKDSGLL